MTKAVCWKFGRSLFQTRVIAALVSFFILSNNFSCFGPIERINWISRCRTLWQIFRKIFIEKLKYSRISPDSKDYLCEHQQLFNFFLVLPIFGHFRATQKNQNWLIWSRKTSCNWEKKFFFILSQKERFLKPIKKKNSYIVAITDEPMSKLCL